MSRIGKKPVPVPAGVAVKLTPHRFLAAWLGVACSAFTASAAADDTFAQVDAVGREDDGKAYWVVTGVLQGKAKPETLRYSQYFSTTIYDSEAPLTECRRMLMVSMARPGRYTVVVRNEGSNLMGCTLKVRAAP